MGATNVNPSSFAGTMVEQQQVDKDDVSLSDKRMVLNFGDEEQEEGK